MRVCNVITGLNVGGAETMLHKLVGATAAMGVENSVVSLTSIGPIGERLAADGVPVRALGGRRGVPDPSLLWKLREEVARCRPHVVHTWMYHANLAGGIAARLSGRPPVIWNIRASRLEASGERRSTILLARLAGRLAPALCSTIIVNSEDGAAVHGELGYPWRMLRVIPNGFDLASLWRDTAGAAAFRRARGIAEDAPCVGMIARYHPQKDHRTFIAAAAAIAAAQPAARFLLAGDGIDEGNATLVEELRRAEISDRTHLLGRWSDIRTLYSALTVFVLSSAYGEGCPNVVGEAMACEVPCVVTRSGDGPLMVGDTGRAVSTRDPHALADACIELLALEESRLRALGQAARARIQRSYSLEVISGRYVAAYREVAA